MKVNGMKWGRLFGFAMLVAASSGIGCAAEAAPQGGRAEFIELRKQLPDDQKAALDFLIENMPAHDMQALSSDLLAEHIEYAFKARKQFGWAKDLSDEMFLNYVLPYACMNETRDAWRKMFFDELKDVVADCKTKGEVAVKMNKAVFERFKVKYSTARPKADQSPLESIAASKASCTGLSIMLVDACRAMGVPARVVGTPQWRTVRGNHTWVEVWDNGWHFLGAAESSALDTGWFKGRAAGQSSAKPKHAIYATSFKRTGLSFPLVWNTGIKYVQATDVTARYSSRSEKTRSIDGVKKLLAQGKLVDLLGKLEKADVLFAAKDIVKVKELVWQQYAAEIKGSEKRRKEHQGKAVSYNKKTMRYAYRRVGKKPAGGYPLYIALHGGGGAPARVNDSQWNHMKVYYLKGVKAGLYLAPRGVTNTFNLHWVNESFACYDRIIENMIVFEDVDPNRVYIMGYSAGGDAAYQIPARAADRWAGAAMSAGHPNGVRPDNYASLAFLIQLGERDSAYNRNKVAAEYGVKLNALQAANPEHYEHATYIHAGRSHGFMDHASDGKLQRVFADPAEWLKKGKATKISRVDCNSIRWLDTHVRDPLPRKVIWDCKTTMDRSGGKEPGFWPTSEKGKLHYWLGLDRYDKEAPLVAERVVAEVDKGSNRITVSEIGNYVRLYLSPAMLDLNKTVTVVVEGKRVAAKPRVSLKVLVQTLLDRGDPNYVFPACLVLSKNPEGNWMLE